MEEKLPERKPNRLKTIEYKENGIYFITLCTENHKQLLSSVVSGSGKNYMPDIVLKPYGKIVENAILQIEQHYENVSVDNYIIMPNHIHLLLHMYGENCKSVSVIIGGLKRWVSHKCGKSIWQKGFYDHVIRDEEDLEIKWNYINDNPVSWIMKKDEYYPD